MLRPEQIATYNPQGNVPLSERKTAALEVMTCREKEVVLKGPARTGKSLAMVHRVNMVLWKYAGSRALLCRKTRNSLNQAALADYETKVVPRNLKEFPDVMSRKRDDRQSYVYPNGSELVIAGLDFAQRIMSTEYDLIAVQEATELTEDDWELLLTRLSHGRLPYQQIMGDMNPTHPNHRLNKRIRDGKVRMLYSRHEDNPRWWDGKDWTPEGKELMDTLQRTSGVRYLRLFKGVDAAAEGAVYPEFLADTHVIDRFPIPSHWRRIRSIDFGFRHPFVCQFWAISPDGVMYLYREIYYSMREVPKHAEQIKRLSDGEKFEATVTDHDAGSRAILRTAGIPSILAYKEVLPGIDAVRLRLQEKRIFFFRDATVDLDPTLKEKAMPQRTVDEFDSYSFEDSKEGRAAKEEPKKVMDDGLDAARYAVAWADDLAKRRFKIRGGRVRGAGQLAGAR